MLLVSQDGSLRLNYEQLVMVGTQPVERSLTAVVTQGGSGPVYIIGIYGTYEDAKRQVELAQQAFLAGRRIYCLRRDDVAMEEYPAFSNEPGESPDEDRFSVSGILGNRAVQNVIIFITAFILGLMIGGLV